MKLPRSTYYKRPDAAKQALRAQSDEALRRAIEHLLDEWPGYGYRRVTHELRRRGIVANHKRVARVMRQHGLAAARPRRYRALSDGGEEATKLYPNLAKGFVATGRNQGNPADPRCA